jgi:hypothetical protein
MSLSAKREALARIHGRYQRAGRPHKTRILDEFCATCGYHRKAALGLSLIIYFMYCLVYSGIFTIMLLSHFFGILTSLMYIVKIFQTCILTFNH